MDNNLEKDAGSHRRLGETDWTDYWIRFN